MRLCARASRCSRSSASLRRPRFNTAFPTAPSPRPEHRPPIGGFGGGPWLDGRVRLAHTAIGYGEKGIESKTETYANVAKISLDALTALITDVRAGRQIKG